MNNNKATPKPGKALSSGKAELLIESFLSEFRQCMDFHMASNVPIACRLEGVPIKGDLSDIPINANSRVYSFYENTNEVHLSTMRSMIYYLKNKESWEDYDICMFDPSLKWCLAISHEGRYTWVTKINSANES